MQKLFSIVRFQNLSDHFLRGCVLLKQSCFFLKGGAQDTLSSKLLNDKRARFAQIKRVHESSKVLS